MKYTFERRRLNTTQVTKDYHLTTQQRASKHNSQQQITASRQQHNTFSHKRIPHTHTLNQRKVGKELSKF